MTMKAKVTYHHSEWPKRHRVMLYIKDLTTSQRKTHHSDDSLNRTKINRIMTYPKEKNHAYTFIF